MKKQTVKISDSNSQFPDNGNSEQIQMLKNEISELKSTASKLGEFSLEELTQIKKDITLLEIENKNLKDDLKAKRNEYTEKCFKLEQIISEKHQT